MAEAQKIIRPHAGFQEKFVRSNVDVCFGGGQLAGGKMNPLYTKVLTPQGWVRMGDLKVGDFVCTPFGKPTRILQIFEHKQKDIYRITTLDGKKADCGLEHLWAVRSETQIGSYRKHQDIKRNLSVVETSQIIDRLNKGKEYYLPNPKAIEFYEKDFIIPPYVLGVLIGDGCITESSWRSKERFMVSNMETDIIERVANYSCASRISTIEKNRFNYIYTPKAKQYYDYLHKVGLTVKSYDKFIPEEYLWGSIEQRRLLLAGLFDTDGTIDKNASFIYSTTSSRLRDNIITLCRSLGYKATYTDKRHEKFTSGHEYLITVQTNDFICSSEKHRERYNIFTAKQYKSDKFKRLNDHSRIKSVEYIGVFDARCIYIEDDMHLYIIDDYITTHNTFGATLMTAEPSLDPRFNGLFLRNNLDDLKAGGGILDAFRECYGNSIRVVESGAPRVDFPSGARIDLTHVAEQDIKSLERRFKGRQYDLIYYDELTGFEWTTFTYLFSRNRGQAKWTGKVRATTNPKRSHWVRKFIDWYVGIDGEIMEEREGVVRYFYIAGENVESVVWGNSKEEVYQKCKIQIDRFLSKFNGKTGKATYKDVIKSFTFYLGRTSENKSLGEGYASSVAAMGGRKAEENSGNWNIDSDSDESAPIPQHIANQVFITDPQTNGDKWVTCDLADTGTDNFLALAWDGFHIIDALILGRTTPRMNAERLELFAKTHGISNSHIIYDAVRGTYINDYIPEAIPFVSYRAPMGMYGRMAYNLKAECYLRLIEVLKRENLSMADEVSQRVYEHQNLKSAITIQNEFMEECSVVRFKDMQSGKKALISKKEMNAKLGKARSMDLLDPIAMRMLPCLEYVYGEELEKTTPQTVADDDDDYYYRRKGVVNIYDDTTWA